MYLDACMGTGKMQYFFPFLQKMFFLTPFFKKRKNYSLFQERKNKVAADSKLF